MPVTDNPCPIVPSSEDNVGSSCDKDVDLGSHHPAENVVLLDQVDQPQIEVKKTLQFKNAAEQQNEQEKTGPISSKDFSEDSQLLEVISPHFTNGSYEGDDGKESTDPGKEERCTCLAPQHQVYISHFLSSWSDRMWMFAGGLFLIEITPGSLRLVAIYEASLSLTVIFLGSAIGRWVDRTSRLAAAQSSLLLQNLMVCACTILLCLLISYKTYFTQTLNGWGFVTAEAVVVFLACLAQMGSLGSILAVEKDWIVIISEDRNVKLSTMNSVLRTVDLSTELLAPVLVGFVMTYAGMVIGGVVIAAWNVTSLLFEYGLLHHLYYRVPALQRSKEAVALPSKDGGRSISAYMKDVRTKARDAVATWEHYFCHDIRDAGLALAFLYMTVLALDNYSRAYVYQNGVSKGVLGILTACASLCGICGSLAFPYLRKRIGVMKTGIFGFAFQMCCLIFCVASVFAPGTCFAPLFAGDPHTTHTVLINGGHPVAARISPQGKVLPKDDVLPKAPPIISNTTHLDLVQGMKAPLHLEEKPSASEETDYTSVALLLTGIITSRFGLWIADLTVTQLLQEQVSQSERCGINGVQSSLNQSLSLLRSILLIILPTVDTFGYLILLSFVFVAIATIMFCVYAYKRRRKRPPKDLPSP